MLKTSSGKPVSGVEVAVHFSGLLSGRLKQRTNTNGEAHFNHKPASGTVYVRGSKVYSGKLAGSTTVYI